MRRLILATVCVWLLGAGSVARAGREAEDLKRQIDAQRAAVSDFERLDPQRTVMDEIQNMRTWLDEAGNLHTQKEYDKVREVLDRCVAQAELLRQKTAAYKLKAQLNERENGLKRSKDRVEKTKQAINQAQINKKALEINVK